MFSKAIARKPCAAMTRGITTAGLGLPDFAKALEQHERYVAILRSLGLEVTVLDSDEDFPDSVFVEDAAVVTDRLCVVARPGAASRTGETEAVARALAGRFPATEKIVAPGTLDGGDVMRVGDRFFVGLSARTNEEGARQLIAILERHGYAGTTARVGDLLHLKTGVNFLDRNVMLATADLATRAEFAEFAVTAVAPEESYAANSLMVNGTVVVPEGFPKTLAAVRALGYATATCDVSEFRKLDGGLSCLSLRW